MGFSAKETVELLASTVLQAVLFIVFVGGAGLATLALADLARR